MAAAVNSFANYTPLGNIVASIATPVLASVASVRMTESAKLTYLSGYLIWRRARGTDVDGTGRAEFQG